MVFGILTLNWVVESSPCSRVSYLHIDKVKMEKSSNREEKYIQRCELLKTSRKITKQERVLNSSGVEKMYTLTNGLTNGLTN